MNEFLYKKKPRSRGKSGLRAVSHAMHKQVSFCSARNKINDNFFFRLSSTTAEKYRDENDSKLQVNNSKSGVREANRNICLNHEKYMYTYMCIFYVLGLCITVKINVKMFFFRVFRMKMTSK